MASIINASSSGSGGIVQTADASGVLQLQTNGTVALNVDTSANISIGTTTANSVAGNSNARYFAVQGDGTLSSADGRIILSNPRAYASISAGSTTAGRLYFQLTNGSGGTITEAANIDALASGSGGASGYGLDIRFLPKADNGSSAEAARIKSGGTFILAGGSTSATGTGITFPATQSASTNANTLDDYEEGTFTTTIAGESNVSAVSLVVGNYIKIGKQVTLFVKFNFTVTSSNLYTYWNFTLPFTSDSSNDNAGAAVENNIGRIGGVSTYGSSATAAYVIFPSASQVPSGVTACYISYTYRATA